MVLEGNSSLKRILMQKRSLTNTDQHQLAGFFFINVSKQINLKKSSKQWCTNNALLLIIDFTWVALQYSCIIAEVLSFWIYIIKKPRFQCVYIVWNELYLCSLQGKAIGITIGCILGMFPLLFLSDDEKKEEKEAEAQPCSDTASHSS